MTLTQLKYVLTVEKNKSFNAAAKELFVAQSGLSESIKDLEEELGITIYNRSNRGITLTKEGEEFLGYARNVMLQYQLLVEHYDRAPVVSRHHFSVTLQHSMLATEIFSEIVKKFGMDKYEYSILEASTNKVIEDVRNGRSEIGLLYMSRFNKEIYDRLFQKEGLEFKMIAESGICIYLMQGHPLSDREIVTMDDLADYPCLIFEQDNNSSFYFYEETIMSEFRYQNVIKTYDRATQLDLIRQLDAYSIGTGKVSDSMKRFGLKIIPLDSEERIFVGYITRRGTKLSDAGDAFITRIKEYF